MKPAHRQFIPTLFLLVCLVAPLHGSDRYLTPGHPDPIALLAPPPEPGSEEQAADLQQVREVFEARTEAETVQARSEMHLSVFIFAQAIGPVFSPGKLPRTEALLEKLGRDTREITGEAKDHWKRPRPYEFGASLLFAKREPSYSYPSGHSTFGTANALVLAELFPDKREAILAAGRRIGWDRVLIGYHFPTDVRAGRVLGQAIARELMASPAFQHDLAEAKAEIAAVRSGP